MTETDNQLLKQFFSEARRQTVADNGFTERVVQRLPDRALRQSRCWTACCVALGLVLFVVFKGWQPVILSLDTMIHHLQNSAIQVIPLFATLSVLVCLALLGLVRRFEQMLA